jgi:hypothetical protein
VKRSSIQSKAGVPEFIGTKTTTPPISRAARITVSFRAPDSVTRAGLNRSDSAAVGADIRSFPARTRQSTAGQEDRHRM